MPFTYDDLEQFRIWFHPPGQATVFNGILASPWLEKSIPLDGRLYHCAGKIFLKNGRELFANLAIRANGGDFLDHNEVFCKLNDLWYGMGEPELYSALGIKKEDALPYTWLPDIPLDYDQPGPHPMHRFS